MLVNRCYNKMPHSLMSIDLAFTNPRLIVLTICTFIAWHFLLNHAGNSLNTHHWGHLVDSLKQRHSWRNLTPNSFPNIGEPIGVAGFGRGALSLPAQLANLSPDLGNQFSYCLVSHSFDSTKLRHPSPLILGKYKETEVDKVSEYVYTPMLENPKHPYFYSVGLEAISVGGRRIEAPENLRRIDRQGNGGVVVDSGTTYTMLPSKLYKAVAAELERRIGKVLKRATETESMTGMRPCFYMHGGKVIPSLALHFGRNSSVVLPRRNFFHEFMDGGDDKKNSKGRKVGCLMMMDAGEEDEEEESGPGATLGNYQQQGFEVVYDLAERRVGFARRECATLWNNLNQH